MFSNIVQLFIFIIIKHKILQMMILWKKNGQSFLSGDVWYCNIIEYL